MTRRFDVVVVGGGIIGLCCAYSLARVGVGSVAIVERASFGSGASQSNGGLICPAVADPLPGPGVIGQAIRDLLGRTGALHVDPRALPSLTGYLSRFVTHCTDDRYKRGVRALATLAGQALGLYDALEADGITGGGGATGYVMVGATRRRTTVLRDRLQWMADHGWAVAPGPILDGRQLVEVEPALSAAVGFGFVQDLERWLVPERLIQTLVARLRALGVTLLEGQAGAIVSRPGDVLVRTPAEDLIADQVVVAAGVWSASLARDLGVAVCMVPGKGYSFSVMPHPPPRRVVYLADAHVVTSPIDGGMRVAGMLDFDGRTEGLKPERVEAMVRSTQPFFRDIAWSERTRMWMAPRPMTADGLPLIGRLPHVPRVIVATGHNMLGMTLAPATGAVVADLAAGRPAAIDLTPFTPDRFGHHWSGY